MSYFEQTPLRFRCTGCGQCCSGDPDYYVYITQHESESIRRHLRLSTGWFKRRYLRRSPQGELVINNQGGGRCLFLTQDNRCGIYAVRPLQCRTYPFWPEVVNSKAMWRIEARRCEGIGDGQVVPVSRIRTMLAMYKNVEKDNKF
jgi:uncharacterized protein